MLLWARTGITTKEVYDMQIDWNGALERKGIGPAEGWLRALLWLVLFHWLQPFAYFLALYASGRGVDRAVAD